MKVLYAGILTWTNFGAGITALAALVTAVATVALWKATRVLAVETRRMVEASESPQIVALIAANQWAINHADLIVENTGNAAAFDIEITFDPPLSVDPDLKDPNMIPLQNISVLKPSQSLRSYLSEFSQHIDKSYTIISSWSRRPGDANRESLSYIQNISEFSAISYLGESDPMIQIASQIKHIREDWRSVASGSRKIKTDMYGAQDREKERVAWEKRRADAVPKVSPVAGENNKPKNESAKKA